VIDITDAAMSLEPSIWTAAETEAAPEPLATEPTAASTPEPEPTPEPVLAAEPTPAPEPEPVIAAEPTPAPEPEPVVAASAATVEPPAATAVEVHADEIEDLDEPAADDRSVAPRAPAPHLPHSPGRQVLEDVFGLMQD
jgi:hypothetical protein